MNEEKTKRKKGMSTGRLAGPWNLMPVSLQFLPNQGSAMYPRLCILNREAIRSWRQG